MTVSSQSAPSGCVIKGNINSKGERIYHTPASPWYDRTTVNEGRGAALVLLGGGGAGGGVAIGAVLMIA